jgi:hypothetical protein
MNCRKKRGVRITRKTGILPVFRIAGLRYEIIGISLFWHQQGTGDYSDDRFRKHQYTQNSMHDVKEW